jgi:hypothetical protein
VRETNNRSIEELEKKKWNEPAGHATYLTTTVHRLRKKKLNDFDIEDLRIMIGQNEGLIYLIPIAIERLKINLFAEGDLYEGDLLHNVLNINPDYWKQNRNYWEEVKILIEPIKQELKERKIPFQKFYSI